MTFEQRVINKFVKYGDKYPPPNFISCMEVIRLYYESKKKDEDIEVPEETYDQDR